jgi:hypothetical protein
MKERDGILCGRHESVRASVQNDAQFADRAGLFRIIALIAVSK